MLKPDLPGSGVPELGKVLGIPRTVSDSEFKSWFLWVVLMVSICYK